MKKKKHQGHQAHHETASHADGPPGRDPLAHESHRAANNKHGIDEGFSPRGGYDGADEGPCKNECSE